MTNGEQDKSSVATPSRDSQQEADRFRALFDSDWYVHLQSIDDDSVNLAILRFDHETIPEPMRKPSQGLILNFEVADPDTWFARAQQAGLPIMKELCDEKFGQRHFITHDPDGILIDIIKPIPPAAEHAEDYLDAEAAGI